jgi:hypothetical protein
MELPFCKTHRAPGFPFRGDGPDLCNGDIPSADKNPFPFDDPVKVSGQVGFHFVNVEPNHGSIVNSILDQVNAFLKKFQSI